MNTAAAIRLVILAALWAGCFPLISVGLDLVPHLAFATMRGALAGASLVAVGLAAGRPTPKGRRSWTLIGVVGLGATTFGFLGMFHAAEYVSPGLATVIANAQPLLAAVLAYVLLSERLTRFGWMGLVIGLSGIGAVAAPSFGGSGREYGLGVAYVIVAALGVATGNVGIKLLSRRADPVMAMGFQLLIGSILLAFASFFSEDWSQIEWSWAFAGILLALAIPGTALAFWLWCTTLERIELNRANAFTFLTPVFGLIVGAILFDERLKWIQAAGIALVFVGLALVQFGESGDRSRPSSAPPDTKRGRR